MSRRIQINQQWAKRGRIFLFCTMLPARTGTASNGLYTLLWAVYFNILSLTVMLWGIDFKPKIEK